jgi:leucyl-tRNA synthetase
MEFSNFLGKVLSEESVDAHSWREASDALMLLLAPTAPHLAEELWTRTGHAYSIHQQSLPKWDVDLAAEEQITFVIQINGKVRDKLTVPASIGEAEARELALSQPRVKAFLKGKQLASVVYVPQKLVNLVVK